MMFDGDDLGANRQPLRGEPQFGCKQMLSLDCQPSSL